MKVMSCKNKLKAVLFIAIIGVMAVCVSLPVMAAPKTYQVVFRAGSHGTVGGESSYTESVPYEGVINEAKYAAMVQEQDGYYFTGWSPDVETVVTKKAVYVAQYAKIIKEVVYEVNYVDENGNAVATKKVLKTNEKASIAEEAAIVEGYQEDAGVKTAIAENGLIITFVYTSTTEPNVITDERTETLPGTTTTETVAEEASGTNQAGAGTTGTQGGTAEGQTQPAGEQQLQDEEIPLGNVTDEGNQSDADTKEFEDEEVPLANPLADSKSYAGIIIASVIILLLASAICVYKVKKK